MAKSLALEGFLGNFVSGKPVVIQIIISYFSFLSLTHEKRREQPTQIGECGSMTPFGENNVARFDKGYVILLPRN